MGATMIGVFDSGHGGLTVLRALAQRFPGDRFVYLGDHANVPYGERPAEEVLALTQRAVAHLFQIGCRLVLLGCNTATAVAARHMQQNWLPDTPWARQGYNVLGIIAPTVEAATQTPWAVTTPQYPQKYNDDVIVVFGTSRTIESGVYEEEIAKRCPRVSVVPVACPGLAGAIEKSDGLGRDEACARLVGDAWNRAQARLAETGHGDRPPDRAILGCTHFPLVESLFRDVLPPATRMLSQPSIVSDSLDDYLHRKPQYQATNGAETDTPRVRLLTTGDVGAVNTIARVFWPEGPSFAHTAISSD